MLNIKTKT